MQIGPTCGLVALSMLLRGEVSPDELLNITKMEGYSNNGEMFSCKNMGRLAKKAISLAELDNVNISVKTGSLFSEEIILELLNGAAMLVAYPFLFYFTFYSVYNIISMQVRMFVTASYHYY